MRNLLIFIVLFLTCCKFSKDETTVNIKLNPKNSGWYFVKLIKDTTLKITVNIPVEINDTERFVAVKINNIDKTIISPFDYNGNSLSSRLQYYGVRKTNASETILGFYNPNDEELLDIEQWNPTNKRAWRIWHVGEEAFRKYFKDTIRNN